MTTPLFTVSMLCFGRASDLRKSLTSVARHCPEGTEVVLVDNGSPDRAEILGVWEDFRSRLTVRLVFREFLSSSLAFASGRNVALALARTPWIVSLDPDCLIGPHFFGALQHEIERTNGGGLALFAGERRFVCSADVPLEVVAFGELDFLQIPTTGSRSNHGLERDKRLPEMASLPHLEHPWDYLHGCNVAYAVCTARAVGGHDESFDGNFGYEDIDFAHRVISRLGAKAFHVPDMAVLHLEPATTDHQPDRAGRSTNPNWVEIGRRIPGYHDFKLDQYRRLGIRPWGLAEGRASGGPSAGS